MAYGDWKPAAWKTVHDGKYLVRVQWSYCQDPIGNTTKYEVRQLYIKSATQYHKVWSDNVDVGISTSAGKPQYKRGTSINLQPGGSAYYNVDPNPQCIIHHDSNGAVPNQKWLVYGKVDPHVSAPDFPTGWLSADVRSSIKSIDRRSPNITASVSERGVNYIKFYVTSDMKTSKGEYKVDNGAWVPFTPPSSLGVTNGGKGYHTIYGLTPNKSYTIKYRFIRDYNQQRSSEATVYTSTLLPTRPNKGSISVSNVTPTSATFTASGFSVNTGASFDRYDFAIGYYDPWIPNGSSNVYHATGLTPGKTYAAHVRMVDNYGSSSDSAIREFTTPLPSAPTSGSISINNITPFEVSFTWSGFKAVSPASISYYEVQVAESQNSGLSRIEYGTSCTWDNLKPNTSYYVFVRAVDTYGTRSSWANSGSFTTLTDQAKVWTKSNGVWKKAKVWVKTDGVWKKVNKVWEKSDGIWKKGSGF